MGLTRNSTGREANSGGLNVLRRDANDKIIALAGNPNVGKSTVFNSLTGLHQHTGNWTGKTVSNAQGYCHSPERGYVLVDVPGTYSLMAASPEEQIARDFICFGGADGVLMVCDGGCLDRNMNLVLQALETGKPMLLCVNLLDEAQRKGIHINLDSLSESLGVPVVGTVARKKNSAGELLKALDNMADGAEQSPIVVQYPKPLEEAIAALLPEVPALEGLSRRFLCLRLLEGDSAVEARVPSKSLRAATAQRRALSQQGIDADKIHDMLVTALYQTGESVVTAATAGASSCYSDRDRRMDSIVTGRVLGYPIMLTLLALVFYITIVGANYPSALLSDWLLSLQTWLDAAMKALGASSWLRGLLLDGAYKTLAWVVSVMLPPMAIFFPLFTLLEDSGYLPRIAYNLDNPFCRCGSCGRQSLTMAMGFGCNAAGVVGCRIINSPRERLLAIITNNLVPCNGRYPTLIALITMFFLGGTGSAWLSALLLTGLILLSVVLTLLSTKLLSRTLLKGQPSAFVLELPPYRKPEIGKVLVRSVVDRTLFVLGRAAAVAAPAGALLWLFANISLGGQPLLSLLSRVLEPLGRLLGMDGVILLAFILGLPANEIVLPIAVMIYSMQGSLSQLGELSALKPLLVSNGWTAVTALCVMLFSLCHWPCSTTLLTIRRETGSLKWTALAAALPTAIGVLLCLAVNGVYALAM